MGGLAARKACPVLQKGEVLGTVEGLRSLVFDCKLVDMT